MRFLADENFNNDILRGAQQRVPGFDFSRTQDTEIASADDFRLLDYAAHQGYILLTHDVNTLRGIFYQRMTAGLPVPGVFLIHKQTAVGRVVEALELIILASEQIEWDGKIRYVPFD